MSAKTYKFCSFWKIRLLLKSAQDKHYMNCLAWQLKIVTAKFVIIANAKRFSPSIGIPTTRKSRIKALEKNGEIWDKKELHYHFPLERIKMISKY